MCIVCGMWLPLVHSHYSINDQKDFLRFSCGSLLWPFKDTNWIIFAWIKIVQQWKIPLKLQRPIDAYNSILLKLLLQFNFGWIYMLLGKLRGELDRYICDPMLSAIIALSKIHQCRHGFKEQNQKKILWVMYCYTFPVKVSDLVHGSLIKSDYNVYLIVPITVPNSFWVLFYSRSLITVWNEILLRFILL